MSWSRPTLIFRDKKMKRREIKGLGWCAPAGQRGEMKNRTQVFSFLVYCFFCCSVFRMGLVLLQTYTAFIFSGTFSHRKSLGLGFGCSPRPYPTSFVPCIEFHPRWLPFSLFSVLSLICGHHFGSFSQVGSGRHFSLCSGSTSEVSIFLRPARSFLRHWLFHSSGPNSCFLIHDALQTESSFLKLAWSVYAQGNTR